MNRATTLTVLLSMLVSSCRVPESPLGRSEPGLCLTGALRCHENRLERCVSGARYLLAADCSAINNREGWTCTTGPGGTLTCLPP